MQTLMNALQYLVNNYQAIITAVVGLLTGIIGFCMLVPGDQPEKTLQSIVDFLSKFSVKK